MKTMLDKILGGLFGQALGDAWAMPALLTPQDHEIFTRTG
jgi:ADP-ribosylglycohydrolase